MKREIEFRGLRVDNNEWVYGYYHVAHNDKEHRVYELNYVNTCPYELVHPESVGQYTGLKDKNGVKIFEGDKVKCSYFKMSLGENLGVTEVDAEITGVIGFNGLSICLQEIDGRKWSEYTGYEPGEGETPIIMLHDVFESSSDLEMSIEIIGNIHQNPFLLK